MPIGFIASRMDNVLVVIIGDVGIIQRKLRKMKGGLGIMVRLSYCHSMVTSSSRGKHLLLRGKQPAVCTFNPSFEPALAEVSCTG